MKAIWAATVVLALTALFGLLPMGEHAAGSGSARLELAQSAPCPNGVCPR